MRENQCQTPYECLTFINIFYDTMDYRVFFVWQNNQPFSTSNSRNQFGGEINNEIINFKTRQITNGSDLSRFPENLLLYLCLRFKWEEEDNSINTLQRLRIFLDVKSISIKLKSEYKSISIKLQEHKFMINQ